MGKIVKKKHTKENPVDNSDIDFSEADALSEEDIVKNAENDPDAKPFSEEELKKIKVKKRHSSDG